jgi:hypothetical protein
MTSVDGLPFYRHVEAASHPLAPREDGQRAGAAAHIQDAPRTRRDGLDEKALEGAACACLRGASALRRLFRAVGFGACAALLIAQMGCGSPAPSAIDGGSSDQDAEAADAGEDATVPEDGASADAAADGGACEVTPPAQGEPDLEQLCGSVPSTLEEWEQCYLKRLCEWQMACFDRVVYHDLAECMEWASVRRRRMVLRRGNRRRRNLRQQPRLQDLDLV